MRLWGGWILLGALAALVVAQLIPVEKTNPPVNPVETVYASMPVPPDIASIFRRSCHDCHSNQTVWPWYSRLAPVSWLVVRDVKKGRGELNLSEWGRYAGRRKDRKLKEICEQVTGSKMPMPAYTLMHPQARLVHQDKKTMCEWTDAARKNLAMAAWLVQFPGDQLVATSGSLGISQ